MKAFSLKPLVFAAVLAMCAAPVMAQSDGADDTVPEILQTQHALRTKLDSPSGEYSRFSPNDLGTMRLAQDKVFRMLDGVSSLDQLNAEQRTDLSNALDQIRATLAQNESSRLVCHRERKTGSNLIEKRCETMGEREARARSSQEQMREYSQTPQERHGG